MDNKKVVVSVLKDYGCQSSKQIAVLCRRLYDYEISPAAVGGVLRALAAKGYAANSNCGAGKTVYWLTEEGKKLE